MKEKKLPHNFRNASTGETMRIDNFVTKYIDGQIKYFYKNGKPVADGFKKIAEGKVPNLGIRTETKNRI